MATLLPSDPTIEISVFVVDLGSARYQVTYTWHERLNGWYFDLADIEGTPLISGRRLEPGSGPLWGFVREAGQLPDVILTVVGPSPYRRNDLGDSLVVVVSTLEELTAGIPVPAQPTVAV